MKVRSSTEQRLLWRPPLAGQKDPLFRIDGMHRVPSMTYDAQNCIRLDRQNVRCDVGGLVNCQTSQWPCVWSATLDG
jgi:hypothetical protein